MTRNKLYALLSGACAAGYTWLAVTYFSQKNHSSQSGICLFKQITTIPCPSCGSTRSVLSLLRGDIAGALYWNPIGVLLISVLLIAPLWMLYDVVTKKGSLLTAYLRAEPFFRYKWVAIPAVSIIIINWIWNIYKGL